MSVKSKPAITDCKATENWTRVTFKPDLKLFNMEVLEEDTAALMRKRAFDIAGSIGKNTKIILNGDRLPIKGFSDYVNLYLLGKDASQRCFEKINDRWEVCVVASEGQFQNVSFVNSINTIKGGTHVTKVADDIAACVPPHDFSRPLRARLTLLSLAPRPRAFPGSCWSASTRRTSRPT